MTIVEMLKAMGGSDERMSRAVWKNKAFVELYHDAGRMFFFIKGENDLQPWIPFYWDLLADDWNFWEMPDENT